MIQSELLSRIPICPWAEIKGRPINHSPGAIPKGANIMESGTTILAMHFKDGILFAGDRKTSAGGCDIVTWDTQKLRPVDERTCFAFAGTVGDGQFVFSRIAKMSQSFEANYGFFLSTEGQANYISTLLRNYYFYWGLLWVEVIIGGIDMWDNFEIYEIDMVGGIRKIEDYTTAGSGYNGARNVLLDSRIKIKDKKLELDEAVDLAIKALYHSGYHDNNTSHIKVATPTIAVITSKGGLMFVEEPVLTRVVDKFLLTISEGGQNG